MIEEQSFSERDRTSQVYRVGEGFGLEFQPQQQFEFFFYATNENNASNLAIELYQLNYAVEPVTKSSGNGEWLINGWTSKMNSDEASIGEWSERMGTLAKIHNCKFDGWGSFIDKKDKNTLL